MVLLKNNKLNINSNQIQKYCKVSLKKMKSK